TRRRFAGWLGCAAWSAAPQNTTQKLFLHGNCFLRSLQANVGMPSTASARRLPNRIVVWCVEILSPTEPVHVVRFSELNCRDTRGWLLSLQYRGAQAIRLRMDMAGEPSALLIVAKESNIILGDLKHARACDGAQG